MSIHMTRDFEAHRTRRKAWDKALSVKGTYTTARCKWEIQVADDLASQLWIHINPGSRQACKLISSSCGCVDSKA